MQKAPHERIPNALRVLAHLACSGQLRKRKFTYAKDVIMKRSESGSSRRLRRGFAVTAAADQRIAKARNDRGFQIAN
jgi:hypothetical protein